ncbi:MAG: zinc-dependent alcohol dehydrogenase family protein [Candidatus Atribacteria bacterium]|nr:zinc-dependent alcohol dehydrogenase family protein [Candidatus Atribacteria bacterium]
MRALVYQKPGCFEIMEKPIPEPKEDEVLFQVDSCGLCGTDIHVHRGEWPVLFPRVTGHEFSGTVIKTGKKATKFTVGDKVVVDPNLGCGQCYYCQSGKAHLCIDPIGVSGNIDGGFEEYCSLPEATLYLIPEELSLEEAAFTEPVACAVHGIDQAGIRVGDRVVIIGGGPMGLVLIQLARISGASQLIVIEPSAERGKLAKQLGADIIIDPCTGKVQEKALDYTRGGGNVVIENVGTGETMEMSLGLVKKGGTVVWFGVTDPKKTIPINPYDIFHQEITLRGSFVNPHTHQRAIDLLASHRVQVLPLITHRFSIMDMEKALETYFTPNRIKIMMKP